MIFKANIIKADNHSVWRRAIQMLSTLHEDIKLTITNNELIVWSMNCADTSMSQIRFKRNFFDEYEFHPENTVFGEDGLQQVEDRALVVHKLYSFKTNGKHLSVLFRKPENDSIKSLGLAIHNGAACPESLANKLQITIHTENLMVKEYVPHIVPIKYDPIVINLRYKKRFLEVYGSSSETQEEQLDPRLLEIFRKFDRELSDSYFNNDIVSNTKRSRDLVPEDEINYLCCSIQLLKNFIDSCNTGATEEIKLEVSLTKLCLTAFTRGVYNKNNDILRNAMRASNTVGTSDLEHYCLFTTTGDDDQRRPPSKVVSFGMKDFRSFINTVASWKNDQEIHMWFCRPGDPVFLELDKGDLCLELVQVTSSNENLVPPGNKIKAQANSPLKDIVSVKLGSPRKSPLKGFTPSKKSASDEATSPLKPKTLFVKEKSFDADQQRWKNPVRGKRPPESQEETPKSLHQVPSEPSFKVQRTQTTIEWGQSAPEPAKNAAASALDQRDILKQEKRRFLENIRNEQEKDIEKNEPTQGVDEFGPTQIDKPKGLFD
ncbi:LAQU0S08e04368g1_1 [Lachancea quebecensis]|uniref:LAQU0S08e04368g1_1 n=1 Tax=Lachancea quebecensis TaxID=1654605 RepID=A0A0P1KTL4_9SACH|nr:LAQU0S08e04368g1_1 [Lachancea quebecensis]